MAACGDCGAAMHPLKPRLVTLKQPQVACLECGALHTYSSIKVPLVLVAVALLLIAAIVWLAGH